MMQFSLRLLSMVLCLGLSYAHAASFDCAKASSKIDNAICASRQVSQLDSDLDTAYKAVLATNSEPDVVKTAQREWLRSTRNQCQDDACLAKVYQQRIDALKASLPKATQDAMADAESENKADAALVAEVDIKKQAEEASAIAKQKEEEAAALAKKQAEEFAVKKKADDEAASIEKKKVERDELIKAIAMLIGIVGVIGLVMYIVILFKRKMSLKISSNEKFNELREGADALVNKVSDIAKYTISSTSKAIQESSNNKNADDGSNFEQSKVIEKTVVKNEKSAIHYLVESFKSLGLFSKLLWILLLLVAVMWPGLMFFVIASILCLLVFKKKITVPKAFGLAIVALFATLIVGGAVNRDNYVSKSNSETDTGITQMQLQKGAEAMMSLHNKICGSPLAAQVQRCIADKNYSPGAAETCTNVYVSAKQNEGCL